MKRAIIAIAVVVAAIAPAGAAARSSAPAAATAAGAARAAASALVGSPRGARTPAAVSYRPACGPVASGRAQCQALVVTTGPGPAAAPLVSSGPLSPLPSATPLGYAPVDLLGAYSLALASASFGATQTVALVDAYDDPTAASDLATYRAQYGLPPCTTASGCFRKVDQRGGTSYPPPDSGWDDEIALDTDMVSAICPKCHILLVEADDNSFDNLGAAVDEAVALGATQISNSYAASEFLDETAYDAYYDHPGIAVTASSGDYGYGVEYPAASTYVTAVGGTSLYQAPGTARGWTETAWAGAGSGCSAYEPKPVWQTDAGCPDRTVADVSAVADPGTGVAVYSSASGGWIVLGGTSVASPIVASYDALVGPAAAIPGHPYANVGSYFDVSSGTNGSCGGSYLCVAGPGYDGPTGLGTPDGATIAPPCGAAPTITTDPVSRSVVAPAAATFTAAASNGDPNCHRLTAQWQVSTNAGGTFANVAGATSPTLTISPTSFGQSGDEYRAVFTNELGSTDTAAATLTVTAPTCAAAPTVTTDPVNQSVTAPAGATFTAAAANGDPNCHVLSVQWQVSTNAGATFANVAGATSPTLTISPTSFSVSGDLYRAVFTNELASTSTTPASLTVTAPPCGAAPTITTNPVNHSVTAPAAATFTAAASNGDPNCHVLTVQWQVSSDGGATFTNVAGATTPTLTISPTSFSVSGDLYRAAFTNELGSTDTAAATLTVTAPLCAAAPTVTTDPANRSVTAPAGATFTAAASNGDPNCHVLTVQWQVSTDGGATFANVAGATSATLGVSPTSFAQSGNEYRAVFTNEFASTSTTPATLTVTAPTCAAPPTVTTDPANQSVTAPAGATFTAAASNGDPNCHVLSVQWQVSTDGGATFADIARATSTALTISPTSSSESGVEYRAVFTNELGSAQTAAATLTVTAPPCGALPTITIDPIDQVVTAPAGATFTAAAANGDPNCQLLSVQWQVAVNGTSTLNGGSRFTNISGATSTTLTVAPTAVADSGDEYRAQFSNERGVTTSAVAELSVDAAQPAPSSPPSATAPPHVTGAALVGATLTVSTGAWTGTPDGYDYTWFDCPDRTGACVQVGADSASYVTGPGDLKGDVYAEVRAHDAGGWSAYVRSDDTITPQAGRAGRGSGAGVTVGRVKVSGGSANVPLQCPAASAGPCALTLRLTVTETVRGAHVIAVAASADATRVRRNVLLGRAAVSLRSGGRRTVTVALGAAGRRLLSRLGHMKVRLRIAQSGRTVFSSVLGFTARR